MLLFKDFDWHGCLLRRPQASISPRRRAAGELGYWMLLRCGGGWLRPETHKQLGIRSRTGGRDSREPRGYCGSQSLLTLFNLTLYGSSCRNPSLPNLRQPSLQSDGRSIRLLPRVCSISATRRSSSRTGTGLLRRLDLLDVGQQPAGGDRAKPAGQRGPSQHFCVSRHRLLIQLRIFEYLPPHAYENE